MKLLHTIIEELNNEELIKGGKGDGKDSSFIAKKFGVDKDYVDKQIEKGIEVEKEHTPNEKMAKEIATDHEIEFPDYYTRLDKLEKEAIDKWEK